MLLHIIARGKIGRSPEAELVDRYLRRLTMPYRVTEMPDRGGKLPPVAAGTVTVMLDEKGRQLGSMDFARRIEGWRDAGTRECRFLIGAADGFDDVIDTSHEAEVWADSQTAANAVAGAPKL